MKTTTTWFGKIIPFIEDELEPETVPVNDRALIHRRHYVIHAIVWVTVFLCGIATDILIIEHLHSQPQQVFWLKGGLETNCVVENRSMPTNGANIEIGFTRSGSIVWRQR